MSDLNSTPLVSVLMTAYNREKFLGEAMASVLASTFNDFELIVVDDCSTDGTVNIAQDFAARDSRVRVYLNEKNLGDYPNRNRTASLARGRYLKYVDSDDLIYPHGLQILVETMEQFPDAGYGVCTLEPDPVRIYPFQVAPVEAYWRHYFERVVFHNGPLSSIIRRDAFESVGGFSGKQHVGDFELWHILSSRFPVVLMPQGVVWERAHDNRQMTDNLTDVRVWLKYHLLSLRILQSEINPLHGKAKELVILLARKRMARFILVAIQSHGLVKALQLLQMSQLSLLQLLLYAFSRKVYQGYKPRPMPV